MKTWHTITIEEYQTLMRVIGSDMDSLDKEIEVMALLSGTTPSYIESLSWLDYTELKRRADWVWREVPAGNWVKSFKANGRRYRVLYDLRKFTFGQFISLDFFLKKGMVENLHNIAACIVQPCNWLGRPVKYEATEHEHYSSDMLQAPFMSLYHSAVFFCKVYLNTMEQIAPTIMAEMTAKGIDPTTAQEQVTTLLRSLGGLQPPSVSQNSSASASTQPTA